MGGQKADKMVKRAERLRIGAIAGVTVFALLWIILVTDSKAAIVWTILVALLVGFGFYYLVSKYIADIREMSGKRVEAHEVDEPEPQYPGAFMTIPPMKRIPPDTKTIKVPVVDEEELVQ